MKRTILTSLAVAAVSLGSLAASADARVAGYSTVEQCTSLSGTITYTPGLVKNGHPVTAILNGTLNGCSGYGTAQAGSGSIVATLSAPNANAAANNETGSFVINWPAASGLNPTTGSLNLLGPTSNLYNLQGADRAGAYTGALLSSQLFITGQNPGATATKRHPITQQTFVNTQPLQIKVNFG
jgi:hypothetical protein